MVTDVAVVIVVVVFVSDDVAEEWAVPEPLAELFADKEVPEVLCVTSPVPVVAEELPVPDDGSKDTLGRCNVMVAVAFCSVMGERALWPHETSKTSKGINNTHATIRLIRPPPFCHI